MNSKHVDQLLKRAFYFEKLAQDQEYDKRGNQFWNDALLPKWQFSFVTAIDAVTQNLAKSGIKVEDLDAGGNKGPGYQLFTMSQGAKLPDPNAFLNLLQQMVAQTDALPDSDPNTRLSKASTNELLRYGIALVKKFFPDAQTPEKKEDQQQPQQQQQSQPQNDDAQRYATETLPMFLSRLYRKLRAGQSPSDFDNSKMQTAKPNLQRRLNGLNGMATRTPQQEQERQVLQFVLSKV